MESNRTYANSKARFALILAALTFLGACREDKPHRASDAKPTIAPNGRGGGSSPRSSDGTSDAGGGTGVQNRVWEAYIVDPRTLRGYNQYLKPIFNNKALHEPATNPDEGDGTLEDMFGMKKWYLVPVELDCVNKDVIGLSFAKSNIDILACQTRSEVWIDREKNKSASDRDFMKLVTHEFVMNVYTLRFEKYSDLLKSQERTTGKKVKLEGITVEQLDALYPAQPVRKLSEADYVIIRAATDWLFEKGATATAAEFEINFESTVVDPRFREAKLNKLPNIENLSPEDIYNLLNANHSAGNRVEECMTAHGAKISDCSMSWKLIPQRIPELATLELHLTGAPRVFTMTLYKNSTLSSTTEQNRQYYQIDGIDAKLAGKKVGDRLDFVSLVFSAQAGGEPRFEFAAIRQSVISKVGTVTRKTETTKDAQGFEYQEQCFHMLESNHQDPWMNNFMATRRDGVRTSVGLLVNWLQDKPLCLPVSFFTEEPAPQP